MKLAHCDMWDVYNNADLFLITTNSFIKRNGALVMGAGIAKQARDRYKGLDLALGRDITHMSIYGLKVSERSPQAKLGAFQVKTHFKDNAKLAIIDYSVTKLIEFNYNNPGLDIHLNYPGIGNGNLTKYEVYPIIECLPDNITIWEYQEEESDRDYSAGMSLMDFGDR